jgi:hypothetical protein
MNRYLITGLYLLILFLMQACSKGTTGSDPNGTGDTHVYNPTDQTPPDLTIQSPVNNQVYASGSTIQVSGAVSDDLGLYRGTVRIINDANGIDVKTQAFEIHGLKNYNYSISHTATVSVPTDYTVVVFFEDHGYNGTTRSVKVKMNP